MKKYLLILISSLFFIQTLFIVPAMATSDPDENLGLLIQGNTDFSFDLYRILKHEQGDLFFSPYSISSALAMTYAGANARTRLQMAKTLNFRIGEDDIHSTFSRINKELDLISKNRGIQLEVANSLWLQKEYKFLPSYLSLVEKFYDSAIFSVDYINKRNIVRQKINNWIEKNTNYKIKNIITERFLNHLTRLVLVNAVYFKGLWLTEFNKALTREMPFKLLSGKERQVQMMSQESAFLYKETQDIKVLELKYQGEDVSMVILLPLTRT